MKKLTIFLFLFAMLLVGCSNKEEVGAETKVESGTKVEAAATTKMVSTINGDIEIPTQVERLVVDAYLPTSLLLGVKPVGATEQDLINVHIQDQIDGIENTGDSSVEKILALKPDLIIIANSDAEAYAKLSKIAPTIVLPYETYRTVEEEVRGLAEILGKQAEGEAWLTEFEEKVQENREKLAAVMKPDETVAIFGAFGKEFYLYGDGIYRGGQAIYKQLQLKAPERIQKELIDEGITYQLIAYEVLPEYAADYIFLDESYGGELDKEDSLWQSIGAVKNDRVLYLDGARFWPFDPIAVLAQVEEVTNLLVDKKKNAE
ncbi:ABC transporter substrate-binding protein [Metasolibacillus meyeri]|uniref:ABC transporter substrate-binding protein n=1 Tax=Metasolibacillus meyeri TaxID=1071052 RepID=A0AAW9NJV0_9BACL|nr:ABC transporter substrate-binding protein [Metasolibacillus meyeri]MEC1177690.1 ABC transporter substrate-binding protein [Metasolibacillus meyeri]